MIAVVVLQVLIGAMTQASYVDDVFLVALILGIAAGRTQFERWIVLSLALAGLSTLSFPAIAAATGGQIIRGLPWVPTDHSFRTG
jgi:hypothetical protein